MKTYIFLAVIIILTSCESPEAKKIRLAHEASIMDSIRICNEVESKRVDSLSLIAWGDSKFGMTIEEARQTKAFKDGWVGTANISLGRSSKHIHNLNFMIASFEISFKMNELYRIDIKSDLKDADYISSMKEDLLLLRNGFSDKYGQPLFQTSFSILDFEHGKEFAYAKWKIKGKEIYIVLGERRSRFYYRIAIIHDDFPTKVDPEDILKLEEQEKIKEERKEVEF